VCAKADVRKEQILSNATENYHAYKINRGTTVQQQECEAGVENGKLENKC
jgi:hypothetical protein